MTWFLVDYCYFEFVQLYTWDVVAENVGFKLTWGCFSLYFSSISYHFHICIVLIYAFI